MRRGTLPGNRARRLAGAMVLPACRKPEADSVETSDAVIVATASVRRAPIRAIIVANGRVRPAPGASFDVVAPQPARVAELPHSAGDRVRKGDLLALFEIPSLEAERSGREADRKRAAARLENAEAALARVEGLFARGIAARKEVEDARRERTEAEAAVAESDAGLAAAERLEARCRVRAPFAGVVVSRKGDPGDLVDPGAPDPILRLVDTARLEVEAMVTLADVPKLKAGAPARVIGPEAYAPEEARLRDVPGSVDPVTATAPIRLELASVSKLPAGAPVRVEITAAERADALVVPTAACVREADETFVYTVGGDGKARRTRVTTGLATEAETEILSGLKEADAVVVAGQTALPDGATVTVRK